tara:strand:- start:1057 stop:1575 length:519 start_codon:yes stop_codon:yes gene_type:complete
MYRGNSQPQIRRKNGDGTIAETFNLPQCAKGGRKENWVNTTEIFENIDGDLIAGAPKFRFEAEYEFGLIYGKDGDTTGVAGGLIDALSQLYNDTVMMNLVPHKDMKFVNYDVIVEELEIPKLDGIVFHNTLKVKFKGVRYVNAIPTIDNMLGCVFYNRIFGTPVTETSESNN